MCEKSDKQFIREWIFTKIWESLQIEEQRGVILCGGPGAGKTFLCKQIIESGSITTTEQHHSRHLKHLNQQLLAYYINNSTGNQNPTDFIDQITTQINANDLLNIKNTTTSTELNDLTGHGDKIGQIFYERFICPLQNAAHEPQGKLLLIVDLNIDEKEKYVTFDEDIAADVKFNKNALELLANYHNLIPPWVFIVFTSRKHGKYVSRFPGFRKIYIDDIRKSQVTSDIQQFILFKLENDIKLRRIVTKDCLEMLNQLHIKSDGSFLYMSKLLDGIAEKFIPLNKIQEIPGTLFGFYFWLCQRIFNKKRQFNKIKHILSLLLATKKPLEVCTIFQCLQLHNTEITTEDFERRMYILRRILIVQQGEEEKGGNGIVELFHHSFGEWIVDVKYCSQRFFCSTSDGHLMLALLKSTKKTATEELTKDDLNSIRRHLLQVNESDFDSTLIPHFLYSLGGEDAWYNDGRQSCQLLAVNEIKLNSFTGLASTFSTNSNSTKEINTEEVKKGNGNNGLNTITSENGEEIVDCSANSVAQISSNLLDCNLAQQEIQLKLEKLQELQDNACLLRADQFVNREPAIPLRFAVSQGDVGLVRAILNKSRGLVNVSKKVITEALFIAVALGLRDVCELLLGYEPDVNKATSWNSNDISTTAFIQDPMISKNESTPLIAASFLGYPDIVDLLLNADADINLPDTDGRTPLMFASISKSSNSVRSASALLEMNAEVNRRDKFGQTALILASFEGRRDICETLLEYGADIDVIDKNGRSALWGATSMGHPSVAAVLLFWGAYVDNIDGEGRTVLSVASAQGNVNLVRLLLQRGLDECHRDNSGWAPLHYAAFEGHRDVVEVLLEYGAKVNDVDNDGRSALHFAAAEGHVNVVQYLIKSGANLHHLSHDGRSCLMVAAVAGHKECLQICLRNGMNINERDADGRTTLYILALESQIDMSQFLIKCGANTEIADFEGRTCLHVTAWQGHKEMTELLLSAGATVNAVDSEHRSPLQSASWQGHHDIVRLLCECGANVNHTCNQGASSLCIAAQEGHLQCVKTLLDYGANVTHADRFGRTALRVSIKNGHREISEILQDKLNESVTSLTSEDSSVRPHERGSENFILPLGHLQQLSSMKKKLPPPKFISQALNKEADYANQNTDYIVQRSGENRSRRRKGKSDNYGVELLTRSSQQSSVNNSQFQKSQNVKKKEEDGNTFSNMKPSNNSKTDNLFSPFAFSRDSHMKIILGSTEPSPNVNKPKKDGLVINGSNLIKAKMNALRTGVFEAATKNKSDSDILVSAASMAVPTSFPKEEQNPEYETPS